LQIGWLQEVSLAEAVCTISLFLTEDARRIAIDIAKLPSLLPRHAPRRLIRADTVWIVTTVRHEN
jgi:hypothetical protein